MILLHVRTCEIAKIARYLDTLRCPFNYIAEVALIDHQKEICCGLRLA